MNKKITMKRIREVAEDTKNHPINFRPFTKLSPYLSYFFARYLPFTPNQISLAWMAIALIGIFTMMIGGYWPILIGLLIYHFAFLLDCVDGEVARATKHTTIGGAYLDYFSSYVNRGMLVLAMGIGVYHTNGNILYLYLGLWSCLFLVFDNLNKLKVFEALIAKDRFDLIKSMRAKNLAAGHQSFKAGFFKKLKSYTLQMLRPADALSLIFFAALFNFSWLYLWIMAVASFYAFTKSFILIYKEIGNIQG